MKGKIVLVFGKVRAKTRQMFSKILNPDHEGKHYFRGRPGPKYIAKYGESVSPNAYR